MSAAIRGLVALLLLALGLGLAAPAPAVADDGGLELLSSDQHNRVEVLRFRSDALAGETAVRVILPEGYDPAAAIRYPVLYLLHGAGGMPWRWLQDGDAQAITAGYPLIVVMPEGGYFGYYADWWNYGAGGAPAWETYHLSELVPWVDAHYATVASRDGRAIAGESMGGLGTMHYAAKRPDLFTAAASFSGAIDTNLFVAPPIVEVSTIAEGMHLPAAVFGPRATEEVRWRGHNPVDLAENLRGLLLTFDVQTGAADPPVFTGTDPVEGAMHLMGQAMHGALTDLGIDHVWREPQPGCHCWVYWQRDLRTLLPVLMERFAHPVPAPSPFTYRSIDASYGVYGWNVAIDRPAVEFSRLSDAGPAGFSLTGSGSAIVTTAPTFEPGQLVRATTQGGGSAELTADDTGRLTVPVSLGTGNPLQQLSPVGSVWALAQGLSPGEWPSVTAHVTFDAVPMPAAASTAAPPTTRAALPSRHLPITGRNDAVPLLAGAAALAAALGLRRLGDGRRA